MGGAYGAKISPPAQLAVACALAAKNLRRPVRTVLDLKTNMELVGKRWPYLVKYNVIFFIFFIFTTFVSWTFNKLIPDRLAFLWKES